VIYEPANSIWGVGSELKVLYLIVDVGWPSVAGQAFSRIPCPGAGYW
jgi:hypothetical protein